MKINQLTFTRFIAAFSVVFFHIGENVPYANKYLAAFFKHCKLSVSFFFILSGFVMIIAYGRDKNVKIKYPQYLKNRIARIYPVYVLAILIFVAFIKYYKYPDIPPKELYLHFLMLQSWFPSYATTLNTPGWSLVVEMFFYVLFPFLFNRFYRNKPLKSLLLPILLFWALSQVIFILGINAAFYEGYPTKFHNLISYSPIMHLNEFLVGNMAGLLYLQLDKRYKRNYDLHITLLCIILSLILIFAKPEYAHNGLLAIIFVPFILLMALNTGRITRIFSKKPFVFLGDISYGLYILHYPAGIFIISLMTGKGIENPRVLLLGLLSALLLLCSLSYLFLEKPLNKYIRSMQLPGLNKSAKVTDEKKIAS